MNGKKLELDDGNLEVITKMNEVYQSGSGRAGRKWSDTQTRFAADYFLKLVDGVFIDPSSRLERKIYGNNKTEIVLNNALNAFIDFTFTGWDFLYKEDPTISNKVMKEIALKLIRKIEGTTFNYRNCAKTAIVILTGMQNEDVLHSAKNTWLEDPNEPPNVRFDADFTNRYLIPEAIQYARQNSLFIR
jgi:hypothetical protein